MVARHESSHKRDHGTGRGHSPGSVSGVLSGSGGGEVWLRYDIVR